LLPGGPHCAGVAGKPKGAGGELDGER